MTFLIIEPREGAERENKQKRATRRLVKETQARQKEEERGKFWSEFFTSCAELFSYREKRNEIDGVYRRWKTWNSLRIFGLEEEAKNKSRTFSFDEEKKKKKQISSVECKTF